MGNLRKARSLYMSRQQEYDKAKEAAQRAESESLAQSTGANKADKKKKLEEEAMHRVRFGNCVFIDLCLNHKNISFYGCFSFLRRKKSDIRSQRILFIPGFL